ncbi:MAG: hypothetical protein V4813_14355 [Gemmatimonadota bacterium]
MRVSGFPLLFVAAILVGCSPDGDRTPTASMDTQRVSLDHKEHTRSKTIHGTLNAAEVGAPQPGSPIIVRRIDGEGIATHLGRFTVAGTFTLNLITATGAGTAIYTAANGDMLSATVSGSAVLASGIATVTETVTVTGGTGRFAGATGTLTVVRRVTQATGLSTGVMDGTITLAH